VRHDCASHAHHLPENGKESEIARGNGNGNVNVNGYHGSYVNDRSENDHESGSVPPVIR
jgi:hypothetical protein